MSKNEQNSGDERPGGSYAKFTGLAFQMIVIIGAFAYAGYRIDLSANHQVKWVTAVMALLGVFISLYIVFKSLSNQ